MNNIPNFINLIHLMSNNIEYNLLSNYTINIFKKITFYFYYKLSIFIFHYKLTIFN